MSDQHKLRITGEVERPVELTFEQLANVQADWQLVDVSQVDPKRQGDAVRLQGLMELAGVRASAKYLGLHSQTDDFHASIPLEPVRERGLLIYRLEGQPLGAKQGGPFRFYIPDFAACHTSEIDECANVKFVDHIEFTVAAGHDNRPHDGQEHEELHRRQAEAGG